MTGNKILLDTNIVSALIKGDNSLINHVREAEEIYLSAIVLGELYYGAEHSKQIDKNKANINRLIQLYETLAVDAETAEIYGAFKAALRKQGTPIPENDIWIAALSKQHGLDLVSRDKHFTYLTEISLINW